LVLAATPEVDGAELGGAWGFGVSGAVGSPQPERAMTPTLNPRIARQQKSLDERLGFIG